jgi:signal transduction histidine kinase
MASAPHSPWRLPALSIGAGFLLAILALLLTLGSKDLLKGARYDDCERHAGTVVYALHLEVQEVLRRVERGERPPEVAAVYAVDADGRVLTSEPPDAPAPGAGVLAAVTRLGGPQRQAVGPGFGAATWLPADSLSAPPPGARGLLVRWDVDAVERRILAPLLAEADDDYAVVLLRGEDGRDQDLDFRVRARPAPPFDGWRIGVGLRDHGVTRRTLRIQTLLLGLLTGWLLIVLTASVFLFARRSSRDEAERRARDQFLTRATHELQTPLALMRAAAETITRGAAERPQDVARCADIVLREEERLTRTVRRLLRYLRHDGPGPEGPRTSLAEEVERTCADQRAALQAHGLELVVNLGGFPLQLQAPRDLVGDTLAELLANARKHAKEGSRVTVTLTLPRPGRARLEVLDDGPGLAPGLDPERVFAPWTGRSGDAQRGSGLGLALLREGLSQVGGAIRCERPGERGCRFVVELPVSRG